MAIKLNINKDIKSTLDDNKKNNLGETSDDVFLNEPEEQTGEFDSDSLSTLSDEEDEYEDDGSYDSFEEEAEYEEEEYEKEPSKFKQMTSSINLDPKVKVGIVVGLLAIIGIVFFTSSSTFKENDGNGVFSSLFGASEEEKEAKLLEEKPELALAEELKKAYPDYAFTHDEEKKQFILAGAVETGEHILTYDYEGTLITEMLNGKAVGAEEPAEETAPATEVAEGEKAPAEGEKAPAEEVNKNMQEVPENSMVIKKSAYRKSTLGLPEQQIRPDDENSSASTEKLIVNYEKLPLKGRIPLLYCRVADTKEKLIFPITIEQYMQIEDVGITVIEVEVTMAYGVTTYSYPTLVDWKN